MRSLPSIDQVNLSNYLEVVKKLDPELYLIKIALEETGINPMIIPPIIRSLSNLVLGTGYGTVQVIMVNKTISQILGEESIRINEKVVVERY